MAKQIRDIPWIVLHKFESWPVAFACQRCGQVKTVPTNGKYPLPTHVSDAHFLSFQSSHADCIGLIDEPIDLSENDGDDD